MNTTAILAALACSVECPSSETNRAIRGKPTPACKKPPYTPINNDSTCASGPGVRGSSAGLMKRPGRTINSTAQNTRITPNSGRSRPSSRRVASHAPSSAPRHIAGATRTTSPVGTARARAKVIVAAEPWASTPRRLVALATPGLSPSPIKIGRITKDPPPASVFAMPASTPASTSTIGPAIGSPSGHAATSGGSTGPPYAIAMRGRHARAQACAACTVGMRTTHGDGHPRACDRCKVGAGVALRCALLLQGSFDVRDFAP